jgi:hypothetical protein
MRNLRNLTLVGILSAAAGVAQATQAPQTARADRSTPVPGSASPAAAEPPKASAETPASSGVRFSGDMRYRHEAINKASPERERQRGYRPATRSTPTAAT